MSCVMIKKVSNIINNTEHSGHGLINLNVTID